MQGIARVKHPNENANATVNASDKNNFLKLAFLFASHACESAKAQSLSVILEKYLFCACVSIFPWVCVGRVNSLALPFEFTFAFASHMWTSLQILRWNDMPIITELNKFSIWQCFFYVEPFCLHFTTFYHFHKIMINKIKGQRFGLFCFHWSINGRYYTMATRYEFYVRVARTISKEWAQ